MKLPTFDEINNLHKKHAPSEAAFDSVWKHCNIVRDIALQLAQYHLQTNLELITAGALLHDIGVYRLYDNDVVDKSKYITHGILGYELLKDEGLDEAVCRFALLHTGVGLTKEDVKNNKLPLPVRDYLAETDEEKIVMYADKFHSKTMSPTFNSVAWYTHYLRKNFGENKVKKFQQFIKEFGEPDLKVLSSRYGHAIR